MNLIGLCLYFLLVACSGARAFHLLAQSLQQTIRSPIIDVAKLQDVPGDSPVKYCEGSNPGSDLFQVDTFDSHPNPLRRGESAVLDLRGIFRDDTGESPKFTFNVTYESQHGIDTVEELCDHLAVVQNDTLSCPPKKGRAYMTTTLFIHETIMPPGNYTARFDAYTEDHRRLFCFFAAVTLA